MRKILILTFLFISLVLRAQTTYYVGPDGIGNNGNEGSSVNPWETLAYAVTQVSATDTIYMLAGKHTINATVTLPVGVSLKGAGETSIITTASLSGDWTTIINMKSGSIIDGNQTISFLKFDGNNLTGEMSIWIQKRHNVVIHHCTFVNFNRAGIYWTGDGGTDSAPPTNYLTGSQFYNNSMKNCAAFIGAGFGCLTLGGHEGMLIHDNYIEQSGRPLGTNGLPIKIWSNGGWMRGLKIYNNTLVKGDASLWDFSIEANWLYGIEVYNNILTGSIDLNHVAKDSYDYGAYIHNNILGPATASSQLYKGVILEHDASDVIIQRNHFRNCYMGIHYTPRPGSIVTNQEIAYNIFDNLDKDGWGIINWRYTEIFPIGTYNIFNNVFCSNPSNKAAYGIGFSINGTGEKINIVNNIFVNFGLYWGRFQYADNCDTINVQNNILFSNGNSNDPYFYNSKFPTVYNYSNNVIDNPDFYSDLNFHPISDSPAIDAGIPLIDAGINISGLKVDFDNVLIDEPPNIGCFETVVDLTSPLYVSSVIENNDPTLLIISFDILLAQIIPDLGSFEVISDSQILPLTSIEIIEEKVHLTLDSPVAYGDLITLSYTIPTSGPSLQSIFNVDADAIINCTVTNNVNSDLPGPLYVSSVIEDNNPKLLIISFSMPLAQMVPDISYFEVTSNSQIIPLTSVAILDGKVHITLDSPVAYGDLITLSYTIPTSGPSLQSIFNIDAEAISNSIVSNNVRTGSSLTLTLLIYPNPVKDSFTLKIEGDIPDTALLFRISDGSGSVVIEKPFVPEMLNSTININLNPGFYIVQILSDISILCTGNIIVVEER